MRSALLISESTGRCSWRVRRQASAAPASPPAAVSAKPRSQVSRQRAALAASSRPLRLTADTGAACSSTTVRVARVSGVAAPGMFSTKVRTGTTTWELSAPAVAPALRRQLKIRFPERVVTLMAASVGSSMKGWSLRATPLPSPARTAPAIESAACAAMLCARACSSGSTRSSVARSASTLRVRVSAWCRTSSTLATAAATSTTTAKAAPAYLNLKLAAVTYAAAAGCARPGAVIPCILEIHLNRRSGLKARRLSVAGPDSLYVPEHQATHRGHGIGAGRENGRPAPQQLPALAAQDLAQVLDVALHGLHVGVTAAVEYFQVAVGTMEVPIESLGSHLRHELRRLAQQIQARGVLHLGVALAEGQGDAAEHELGIQPVTAFLQVTAVGHLGDHVRRAEQVANHDVTRIGNRLLDARERHFVTGEVDDLRCHRHPGAEAQHRQVLFQEARAARHVRAGELGAVARVALVGAAQIAHVVKQAGHEADHSARAPQAGGLLLLPFVAHEKARERQSYVERVLPVVVHGVDAVVSGNLAGEQAFEMFEGARQRVHGQPRPRRPVERLDRGEHRRRRAHLHAVGHVKIAAPGTGHGRRKLNIRSGRPSPDWPEPVTQSPL